MNKSGMWSISLWDLRAAKLITTQCTIHQSLFPYVGPAIPLLVPSRSFLSCSHNSVRHSYLDDVWRVIGKMTLTEEIPGFAPLDLIRDSVFLLLDGELLVSLKSNFTHSPEESSVTDDMRKKKGRRNRLSRVITWAERVPTGDALNEKGEVIRR